MANIIDPGRYQLVADASPLAQGIGSLISQRIAQSLADKAMAGDSSSMSQLAVRDPRAASAIGGILQDQKAEEQKKQALSRDMAYRVARGYLTAKDKAGYLASASQQLRQGGFADLAAHVDDDITQFAKNPDAVTTEYQSLHDMLDPMVKAGDVASIRDRQDLISRLPVDENGNLKPVEQMTAAERLAAVDAGLIPRAGISADERIAGDPNLTQQVARSQAVIAGATAGASEGAKLGQQLDKQPEITKRTTAAQEGAKADVAKATKEGSAARDEREIDRLLTKADGLLDTATGSYTGSGLDLMARAVGIATKGGISATKLKTLEAALVLKMPRMEGPQSDRDAALYKQAAGLIGDATVPAEERKAAIETIRFINSRYSAPGAAPAQSSSAKPANTAAPAAPASQKSIDDLLKQYGE